MEIGGEIDTGSGETSGETTMLKSFTNNRTGALLALLSLTSFDQPALSQSADANDAVFLVSGSAAETFELTVHLRKTVFEEDGTPKLMATSDCEASLTIEAIDINGSASVPLWNRRLDAGATETFELPFSVFSVNDASHALIRLFGLTRTGPCELLAAARSKSDQGETLTRFRLMGTFEWTNWSRLDTYGANKAVLVSGNVVDESVRLAFHLENSVTGEDGGRKIMSAADCAVSFNVHVLGLTSGREIITPVSLEPGSAAQFHMSFGDPRNGNGLGSGQALFEFTKVRYVGPCEMKAGGWLIGKEGGEDVTRAAIPVPQYQTFAIRSRSPF